MEYLFKLKDHNNTLHTSYVGETARNHETRVEERVDITKTSEPDRHIKSKPYFKPLRRRVVEAFYIATIKLEFFKK